MHTVFRWPRQVGPGVVLSGVLSGVLLALAAATPAAAQSDAARPGASAPGSAEMEFWKSAERIGTPDAYRAFLAAFPEGFYAAMARAALAKFQTPINVPAGAAPVVLPAVPAGTLGAGGRLQPFGLEAENSGVVTFRLGDRFTGPGVVWVGRFGAKKQLPLPAGEWVVLAAVDTRADQAVNYTSHQMRSEPVDISTLVFGRFAGSRLVSLLRFTINGRAVTVPTWTDLIGCEAGGTQRWRYEKATVDRTRDECSGLRSVPDVLGEANPAAAELRDSLKSLGAVVSGAALTGSLSFGDRNHGYLGLNRVDWPGHLLGAAADNPAVWTAEGIASQPVLRAYVDALAQWLADYRSALRDGYWRDSAATELRPGGTAPAGPAPAGLTDFDPSRR